MLQFIQVSLRRQQKILLDHSNFLIKPNQKVGLIGVNGCGKSSLFAAIKGQLEIDSGEIKLARQTIIGHLAQEIPQSELSCHDFVIAGDSHYLSLHKQLNQATRENDDAKILDIHDEMHQYNAYAIPAKAAQILSGLGIPAARLTAPVNQFSGGWRMRISLARCLMSPAELLLLDEPTNHLDLEAILWLENWLNSLTSSMIIISHDREFLDAVTTHILHIEHQTTQLYSGNYSQFERLRAQQLSLQAALYQKQQKHIEHMMGFVHRFRAKASKAKQAQSRLRAVEKMELVAQAHIDSPLSFSFYPCPKSADPLITMEHVDIGYQQTHPIIRNVTLSIRKHDRIGILGPNGAGKSSFLKTLTGELPPLSGKLSLAPNNLSIAYYAQYQLSQLDSQASALTHIQRLSPDASEQEIHNFLGGFDFSGDKATTPIAPFSGGEKARIVLAMLVWQKPNLLLLDEPTNHLDMEMRTAIEIALQAYEGAMILISHDRHLLKTTVDTYCLLADHALSEYKHPIEQYTNFLPTQAEKKPTQAPKDYKFHKIKQNRIKTLEKQINQLHARLLEIDTQLADNTLYTVEQNERLMQLQHKKQTIGDELNTLEEEWLDLME